MSDAAASTETQATATQTGDAAAVAVETKAGAAAAAATATATETTTTETKAEEYTLAPIEGGVLDEAGVAQVQTIARDLGLGKEAAEKLLAAQDGALRAFQDGQINSFRARQQEWDAAAQADPEIGGDKAPATQKHVAAVLQRFDADGSFKQELEATGFIRHPLILRHFARIGAAMGEDSGAGNGNGQQPAGRPPSDAEIFYGTKK